MYKTRFSFRGIEVGNTKCSKAGLGIDLTSKRKTKKRDLTLLFSPDPFVLPHEVRHKGVLVVSPDGDWEYSGYFQVYDTFDYNWNEGDPLIRNVPTVVYGTLFTGSNSKGVIAESEWIPVSTDQRSEGLKRRSNEAAVKWAGSGAQPDRFWEGF